MNHYLAVVGTVKGEVKCRVKRLQLLLVHTLLCINLKNCALALKSAIYK